MKEPGTHCISVEETDKNAIEMIAMPYLQTENY